MAGHHNSNADLFVVRRHASRSISITLSAASRPISSITASNVCLLELITWTSVSNNPFLAGDRQQFARRHL